MNRFIATRAQREAVLALFKRHYWDQLPPSQRESLAPKHYFPSRSWWRLYRLYRKRFEWGGIGTDRYLFGAPFGDNSLFVGIEADGYTHS